MAKKILVIEDSPKEAANAKTTLQQAGKNFHLVTTLSEALNVMPQYDGVLSDLFFPAGISPEEYAQRFLPHYEKHKEQRFRSQNKNSPVLRAVEQCAKTFGMSPREYVENFMAKLNTPKSVLSAAREAVTGIREPERYQKFLQIEQAVRDGTSLPLGIVATERATELGIPSVIVTSAYHHGDEFQPVSHLIKVQYVDTLVNENKNWSRGLELLLNER